MNELIKIDSVFLDFRGNPILRGINLSFERNKVVGILGRNGSGKSSLLKVIIGQIQPLSKHIKYNDKLMKSLYKEKGLINYLPQHTFHPKSVSLKQLLDFYEIEFDYFLNEYPFLEKHRSDKFSALSGGARRIIEVLLVLESKTKFSILDEPFSHIMPIHINLVKDRIVKLKTRKGILLTDHQYRNVIDIADDLLLIKSGVMRVINNLEDLRFYGYIR